ncbi:MAG: glycerophosphoryl diester phosphodiesterase, partial [Candidatus Azotimanducaceae bacterium]
YTVDDRREMENLKEIGVDGIFTNYPDNFPFDE